MMDESTPYLSIVATTRNDDHGGNLSRRTQWFVDGLLEQCDKYRLPAELILVEWNPPPDRPPLVETIEWNCRNDACRVRIITVPPELHRRYAHSDRLPLFQMIGKNVGIRRARGQFVLATNVDILFSDELIAYLASRPLRPRRCYRVDRLDVRPEMPDDLSREERLRYCRENVLRANCWNGTFFSDGRAIRFYVRARWLDLLLRTIDAIRWPDVIWRCPTPRGVLAAILGPARLHINACGDFTLMAKEDWFRLRGYAELEIYSWNLDTVLCHNAWTMGMREVILSPPCTTYHIEHTAGFIPEKHDQLFEELSRAEIPRLGDKETYDMLLEMRQRGIPKQFNDETWGLANDATPEWQLQ